MPKSKNRGRSMTHTPEAQLVHIDDAAGDLLQMCQLNGILESRFTLQKPNAVRHLASFRKHTFNLLILSNCSQFAKISNHKFISLASTLNLQPPPPHLLVIITSSLSPT